MGDPGFEPVTCPTSLASLRPRAGLRWRTRTPLPLPTWCGGSDCLVKRHHPFKVIVEQQVRIAPDDDSGPEPRPDPGEARRVSHSRLVKPRSGERVVERVKSPADRTENRDAGEAPAVGDRHRISTRKLPPPPAALVRTDHDLPSGLEALAHHRDLLCRVDLCEPPDDAVRDTRRNLVPAPTGHGRGRPQPSRLDPR